MEIFPHAVRYRLKPDRYSSHGQIAEWLSQYKARALPQRPCVVYDIGCAQGWLGRLLDPADFLLFGVDSDATAVAQAQSVYAGALYADIEAPVSFVFPAAPDVMVLADVLEHTRQPWLCLERLCRVYLPPQARVVVSLPNMAHVYIRLQLLMGHFDYAECGLLDRDHLRFFTLATALNLVRGAGITIEKVSATPVPLPLVHAWFNAGRPGWPIYCVSARLARMFKTLAAYQFIIYGIYNPAVGVN